MGTAEEEPTGAVPKQGAPGLRPPRGHPRFPLLDGVRGIGVIMVVLTHVAGRTGTYQGFLGDLVARSLWVVAAFFIISGFLLYRPWVAARDSTLRAPTIRGYLVNRALRILPAYWSALLVLSVYPGLPQLAWPFGHAWWAYWGFLAVYIRHWIFGGIGQAWTIDVEITFYLLLPVYVVVADRAYRRYGFAGGLLRERLTLGVLALGSVAFRVLVATPLSHRLVLYTLPSWFAWFAIGMLLALLSVDVERRSHPPRWVRALRSASWVTWVVAFALLVWLAEAFNIPKGFALLLPFSHHQMAAEYVIEGAMSTLVVLPGIFAEDVRGLPQRVLGCRPIAELGVISYGVYIWHSALLGKLYDAGAASWLPGNRFISLLVFGAATSLLAGWASFHFIEAPFLRKKR
jgi:peptidoglycan/LPS O-acetylase OafA/YrhL